MKRILIVVGIIVCCFISSNAQDTVIKPFRQKISLGTGFGINRFITYWSFKYTDPGGVTERIYPEHKFIRQGIFFDFETRSIWVYKRLHVDFGYTAFYGFFGNTREISITSQEEIISDGGNTYGFGIFYKLTTPFWISADKLLTPYTGIIVQGAFFSSNGKGVSENIDEIFNYDQPWNEGIIGATVPIGLEFEMKKIIFFTEFRYMYLGVSFTDWSTEGSNVKAEGRPKMNDFQIGLLYKI